MRRFINILAWFVFSLLLAQPAHAGLFSSEKIGGYSRNLDTVAGQSGVAGTNSLEEIIGTAIRVGLSVLGVVFITLIFLAGHEWATASGNEEKVNKAKSTIRNLVIGLIILLAAYALSFWISETLSSLLITT